MYWAYSQLVFDVVAPGASEELSGFNTLTEFRDAFPTPSSILWDTRLKSRDPENRCFLTGLLYRHVRTYIRTGHMDDAVEGIVQLLLKKGTADMDVLLQNILIEVRMQAVMAQMMRTDLTALDLTPDFFQIAADTHVGLLEGMRISVMHTAVHIASITEIMRMYEMGRNMMQYYRNSCVVTADVDTVIAALNGAVWFQQQLHKTYYRNAMLCYYLGVPPMAVWAADAVAFITMVNQTYEVQGCRSEPAKAGTVAKPGRGVLTR